MEIPTPDGQDADKQRRSKGKGREKQTHHERVEKVRVAPGFKAKENKLKFDTPGLKKVKQEIDEQVNQEKGMSDAASIQPSGPKKSRGRTRASQEQVDQETGVSDAASIQPSGSRKKRARRAKAPEEPEELDGQNNMGNQQVEEDIDVPEAPPPPPETGCKARKRRVRAQRRRKVTDPELRQSGLRMYLGKQGINYYAWQSAHFRPGISKLPRLLLNTFYIFLFHQL